ncbi:LHCP TRANSLOCATION DEFECT-like [Micractinium conductrix]|uniref:LHCP TRANSLOCATION DEFECT-like n=1 Tax=Micractinium conductrix TaxID=554055 RepID=A0A2P6VIP4_9CHLO|nr:LHCP TRANSLOCATION DEFECT-like [Micractinium conductrix]|eukprot:PSC73948.1 LHCP TRANSLOCATION DEFECT-like [Micractinium conductrix]
MQAVASSMSSVVAAGARRARGGQQLRRAAANGARCRAFFKFGGGKEQAKNKDGRDLGVSVDQQYWQGEKRDDYQPSDVQDYFMYMGMLASEGTYDRCEAMLASGTAPVDLLLLMACQENDDGKVEELLESGANPSTKDLDGRPAVDITTKPEIKEMLQGAIARVAA